MDDLNNLLVRAQGGDLEATGELVRRFQTMAVGYAYSLLGDFHLAEDAAQTAFMEAWVHLDRVYNGPAFPAWLKRIVFKHCDRIGRKRKDVLPLEAASAVAEDVPEPLAISEEGDERRRIQRALVSLPELERQIVVLCYVGGHSRQQVAQFLDLPLQQVVYRLRSARRLFKEILMDQHAEPNLASQSIDTGRRAFADLELEATHPQLAQSIGALADNISTWNGQNLLQHSLDVARLAGLFALPLGLDPVLARRAGLLHDMGKILRSDSTHADYGAQKAAEMGEDPEVVEVIATHHTRGERFAPVSYLVDTSALCFLVRAADGLVAGRFPAGAEADDLQKTADELREIPSTTVGADTIYVLSTSNPEDPQVSILARSSLPPNEKRAAAPTLAEETRSALGFSGRVFLTISAF
jgi:RNA polymerase sigma factor (sigma-70 family)